VITKFYANHNTDRGVWCVWSYTDAPADAEPEGRCPAECASSRVITGADKVKVVVVVVEET
jgi:hypothetical protein